MGPFGDREWRESGGEGYGFGVGRWKLGSCKEHGRD